MVSLCRSAWIPVEQSLKSLTCHCAVQFAEHPHPLYLSPSDLLTVLLFPLIQVSVAHCDLYLDHFIIPVGRRCK